MERQEIETRVERQLRIARVGWVVSSVMVVIVALGVWRWSVRYQVVPLGEGAVLRLDQRTGEMLYCTALGCEWDVSSPTRPGSAPTWWMGPFDSQAACDDVRHAMARGNDWFTDLRRSCERR